MRPFIGDGREQEFETHAPAAALLREIGADEEGLLSGGEDRGQRPAAAAVYGNAGAHIDAVHVGPLFAVDLDGDEVFVQNGSDLRVLKGLVRHDVAPVAGGIADGEEDGLVLPVRLLKCLLPPGIPVHGVFRVLTQVGRFFVFQSIAHVRLRQNSLVVLYPAGIVLSRKNSPAANLREAVGCLMHVCYNKRTALY